MSTNENMHRPLLPPVRRIAAVLALCAVVATGTATWLSSSTASAEPKPSPVKAKKAVVESASDEPTIDEPAAPKKSKGKQAVAGKLNLNTASSEQLQLLPGVGPSKADRIVTWRKKNGNFKRVADLRKVKGFGYKTLKKLEPFLDIKGDTTLAAK